LPENIVSKMNDFRGIINQAVSIKNQCEATIKECEGAICDIRHYLEFNYPVARSEKTKLCKMIHQYQIERRKAKNTLITIEPLTKYLEEHKNFINEIGKLTNEMNKLNGRLNGQRIYVPRILNELFKG